MFAMVDAAFYMSSRNAGELQVLHVPPNTWFSYEFDHCHLVNMLKVGPVVLIRISLVLMQLKNRARCVNVCF